MHGKLKGQKNLQIEIGPGNLLAYYDKDNAIKLFDITKMKVVEVLKGHRDWVNSVSFSSENLLASGSEDKTVRLWDLVQMKCLGVLEGHTKAVDFLMFGRNNLLVSSSRYETIRVWDWKKRKCIHILERSGLIIHLTPTDRLCSIFSEGTVQILDVRKMNRINTLEGHRDVVNCVSFGANKLVASGSDDETIKLWDLEKKKCLHTIADHSKE